MMRQLVAVMLAGVCCFTSNPAFAGKVRDQTPTDKTHNLKEQVVMIPAGTIIEVKLRQKGSKKITGKLGPVTDEGESSIDHANFSSVHHIFLGNGAPLKHLDAHRLEEMIIREP